MTHLCVTWFFPLCNMTPCNLWRDSFIHLLYCNWHDQFVSDMTRLRCECCACFTSYVSHTHTSCHTHTHIQSHTHTHTITHTHTHTLCVECHINRRRVIHTIDLHCRRVIRTTDWGVIGRAIRRLTWPATYDTPTIDVTYTCYISAIDMTLVTRLRCALALCFTRSTVCVWHAYDWHDSTPTIDMTYDIKHVKHSHESC